MAEFVIAVDAGGTKLAAAAVDAAGVIRARVRYPVEKSDFEHSVGQIVSAACEVAMQVGGDAAALGLIVPGIYSQDTGHAWAPNLWGPDQVPLLDAVRMHMALPVTIESDRCGYVLGEHWMGAARGLADVVFLAVGTGIGAGIISGGQLVRGAAGIAGAVGWFALSRDRQQRYAQTGCWEAESAGPALARHAGVETAEQAVAAARAGDAKALHALAQVTEFLSMGIANLVSLLNPQMVVLGGGLMQAGDLFLEPLRAALPLWAQPIAARQARIELTALGEDAGLLGAARLAWGCQL
jgi:glucokinase